MDDAQQEALASLTAQMFAEPIATGEVVVTDPEPPATPAPPPVATAPPVATEPPAPVTVEEAAPEPVAAPPENVPTFKAKLDDELQALIDEPDFEEEAAAEVAAEVEDGEYEYADETTAKLRALEKRNQFLEDRNVAISRKNWVEEGKRVFPDLARLLPGEIESITATSRRAFLREANTRNERYKTVFAPTLAKLEADRAAIAAGAMEVARGEVADAWGKPAADTLPAIGVAQEEALAKARAKVQQTGDLTEVITLLMNQKPVL